MTSEVASADGAPDQAHPVRELHDPVLLLDHAAPPAERCHPPPFLLSEFGGYDVEHAGGDGCTRGPGAQ